MQEPRCPRPGCGTARGGGRQRRRHARGEFLNGAGHAHSPGRAGPAAPPAPPSTRTCGSLRRSFPEGWPRPATAHWLSGPWRAGSGRGEPRRAVPGGLHPRAAAPRERAAGRAHIPHVAGVLISAGPSAASVHKSGGGCRAPFPRGLGARGCGSRTPLGRQRGAPAAPPGRGAQPSPAQPAAAKVSPGPARRRSPCPGRPGAGGGPAGIASRGGRRQVSGAAVPAAPCRWGTS